jgi:hypothetical protein
MIDPDDVVEFGAARVEMLRWSTPPSRVRRLGGCKPGRG